MIDDLPFLDDLETAQQHNMSSMLPDGMPSVNKYIRHNEYNPPPEAGMRPQNPVSRQVIVHHQPPPPPSPPQQQYQEPEEPVLDRNFQQQHPFHYINCVTVAEHANNCVVCSRLYSCDKTIYYIIIAILVLVCILLARKVLERK